MDSFTENILARARERQKMIENYSETKKIVEPLSPRKAAVSQPNLSSNCDEQTNFVQNFKATNSEGNISRFMRQNSTTRVSSEITSSSSSPKSQLNTLNIQNDNFNMEIKVSSAENVRVEVQIEEHESDGDSEKSTGGLRPDAKHRLNRLGKLYAGGEDADISSPIHRTEANFHADSPQPQRAETKPRKGLNKLANLAQNITEWEDEVVAPRKDASTAKTPIKKSWKPPAPQPPAASSPRKPSPKSMKAPSPPRVVGESPKKEPAKVKWDKKVLDTLESQGFTRTDSSTRLVYKYDKSNEIKTANTTKVKTAEKENLIMEEPESKPKSRTVTIADKAALFESSPNRAQQKDPALLSVSERKALFEKNKGSALVPKAAFGMAAPINKPKVAPKTRGTPEVGVKAAVTQAGGIANKMAALLEGRSTISQVQIESGVKEQRQKEMDMLLNRFHKVEDEKNEESDDEDEDVDEETKMISEKGTKIVAVQMEKRRNSGNKRCSKADSPKVAAVLNDVKRIKVASQKAGRLYPSLTDIESVTETENETENGETRSPTPNNSSFGGSIAESDDANTSFGRDILRAVCKSQTPQKRQILDESSDMSEILDDMDDYIDEALAYNESPRGPTPPKQGRKSPIESSHSFHYKSFQAENFKSPMKKTPVITAPKQDDLPTHVLDGNNLLPLTHTVSFYRKQQTHASNTPVRHVNRQPVFEESAEEESSEDQSVIVEKMAELKMEVRKQEMIISQTSQALNLCNSTPEFMGSTEQVEAERVLLVATHRRQAALHELQRLKVENSLRPQGQHSKDLPLEKGNLTISKIVLPLKKKYVTALAAAGGKGHHVVCLVKYDDQVLPTQLVSTVATNTKNPDMELEIPGTIKIKNVYSDFTVTFEVYCLQAQEEILSHELKYHIKKAGHKSTPKKSKQDSRLLRPMKESPAGPQAVRSPTFALMGYLVFSLRAINKKQWTLNNAPSMSPLDGVVEMSVSVELDLSVEHRGFLTMFEDVSGFGAWHRRWCLLKGHTLSYWKYPDDERKTPPINSINLSSCVTKKVGPVSREICARLHTFLFEIERIAYPHDKDTLVTVCKGDKTIIRHLLSADTKEERIEWCGKFNAALAGLTMCSLSDK